MIKLYYYNINYNIKSINISKKNIIFYCKIDSKCKITNFFYMNILKLEEFLIQRIIFEQYCFLYFHLAYCHLLFSDI